MVGACCEVAVSLAGADMLESTDGAENSSTTGGITGSATLLRPNVDVAGCDGGLGNDIDLEFDGGERGERGKMPMASAWSATRLVVNISTSSDCGNLSVRTSQACLLK